MAEQTQPVAPPGPKPTFGDALTQVIKGLKDQYPLLFGIGAGIVLIGVLGVTGNVTALAIVAAVLVIALVVWLIWAARIEHRRDVRAWRVRVSDSNLTRSPVGTRTGVTPAGGTDVEVEGTTAVDSPIGTQKGS
jgi:hypothetical protein